MGEVPHWPASSKGGLLGSASRTPLKRDGCRKDCPICQARCRTCTSSFRLSSQPNASASFPPLPCSIFYPRIKLSSTERACPRPHKDANDRAFHWENQKGLCYWCAALSWENSNGCSLFLHHRNISPTSTTKLGICWFSQINLSARPKLNLCSPLQLPRTHLSCTLAFPLRLDPSALTGFSSCCWCSAGKFQQTSSSPCSKADHFWCLWGSFWVSWLCLCGLMPCAEFSIGRGMSQWIVRALSQETRIKRYLPYPLGKDTLICDWSRSLKSWLGWFQAFRNRFPPEWQGRWPYRKIAGT